MPISRVPNAPRLSSLVAFVLVASLGGPGAAQDGHTQDAQKPKPAAEKPGDTDASRYCANVAASIAEARLAWQTKRLNELDAQVKQRISDLEKAEAVAREWIAKREELMKAASDALVAIYAKMQPENAAQQISTMDDRMAAAILGKLKPTVAGAILDEMEAERASRLAGMIAGAEEKKS
jgi:flagellar motility protein MotE (MotC chaperone)